MAAQLSTNPHVSTNPDPPPTLGTALTVPLLEQVAYLQRFLHKHQLATPLLLWLAGHQPLTFATGQMLHLLAPAAGLLGYDQVAAWGDLLAAPTGPAWLIAQLQERP